MVSVTITGFVFVSNNKLEMPKKKIIELEHDCKLNTDADEDVLNQIIETGICIDLRRKLCRLSMVHEDHPQTQQYFKSRASRRREELKHLVHYVNMTHPFSLSCLYWEFLMFWNYFGLFVICSVSVAYLNEKETLNIMNNMRSVGDYIQTIDMFRLFFVGYYSTKRGRTIMKPIDVAKHYVTTYFFVDLISTLPSHFRFLRWVYGIHEINTPNLRILRITSILKIFRMNRFLNALELFRQYMGYSSYWFKAIKAVLLYLTFLLWLYGAFFCIMIVIFIEFESGSKSKKHSFLRATRLLLVITHGHHVLGFVRVVIFACFTLLVGYLMQLFLFAEVMQVWNKFVSNTNENLLQQFKAYMKYKGLPLEIRNRMFTYFNFKFRNEFFNEAQINSIVSDHLKQEILMHLMKNHLTKARIFKGVPESILMKIASRLKSVIYLPDDVIITVDTPGTSMYFIYFGTVAVYTAEGKEIFHLEDGANFGEVALVFDQARLASVVAVTPCEVFKLKRSDFMNAIEPFADIKAQISANARETLLEFRIESF